MHHMHPSFGFWIIAQNAPYAVLPWHRDALDEIAHALLPAHGSVGNQSLVLKSFFQMFLPFASFRYLFSSLARMSYDTPGNGLQWHDQNKFAHSGIRDCLPTLAFVPGNLKGIA